MSRYLVKFDELNTKNNYLDELLEKLDECINNIESAKENIDWEGPAKEKFDLAYDNYLDEARDLYNNLVTCLNVSKAFHDNFNECYNKVQSRFSKLNDEMVIRWKTGI